MIMRFMAISDARNMFSSFADMPENTVLTRNGQPVAVVMPIQEYRALRALSKLAENPDDAARVATTHERVRRGDLDFKEVGLAESENAVALRTS
jgi:prevent-host-death family protein